MSNLRGFLARLEYYAASKCIESGGNAYTYSELVSEMRRWEGEIGSKGIVPGSVIGLRSDYSLRAVGFLLASLAQGHIVALIPRDRNDDRYLRDAIANCFVDMRVDGSFEWRIIRQTGCHQLLSELRAMRCGGFVIFTSGSTGAPKAALHGVERFLQKFTKPGRKFRTLALMQFDHIAGLDNVFRTLSSGGTLIVTRQRDPRSILEIISSEQVEALPASPTFLRLLCLLGDLSSFDTSTLRVITYGSEVMDPTTLSQLQLKFPKVQIVQKYGTTETGSPRTLSRQDNSLWLKFNDDGVETRVIGDVLWIRSQSSVLGYLNSPSPITKDGWYCSGDLVDVDGEWIKFRGRNSDAINVGGEKVSPTEIEQTILELEFVQSALVYGEAHPLMGQIVCANVGVISAAVGHAAVTIRRHCAQKLPRYKVPVKIDLVEGGLTTYRYKTERRVHE